TITGSDSRVTRDTIWRMRSGLPTLVPPNFITFMWILFSETAAKIIACKLPASRCEVSDQLYAKFFSRLFEICDHRFQERNSIYRTIVFKFTFRITGHQHFFFTRYGATISEPTDPVIHCLFEF